MFDNCQLIDLTLTIDEQLPCTWPPHIPFQKKIWNWYRKEESTQGVEREDKSGPYFTEWLLIDEHIGTHFDAPSHFIPLPDSGIEHAGPAGEITGEKLDLRKVMGPAAVVDLRFLCDQGTDGDSPFILPKHIQAWEKTYGEIQENEIVLFYTGWDKYYLPGKTGRAWAYDPLMKKQGSGWPSPDVDVMQYLYEKGVRCVGTDGASMGSTQNGAPVHFYGLGKGMVYLEALCNLGQLPPRGSHFIFLPIKIKCSSGGPGRAIALVNK
jgi:kynurenine formamidase